MLRFWNMGAANNLVGVTCCIKELLLFRVDQWLDTPHTANRLLPSYYFCLFTETWMRGSHRKASGWVVKLWASWSISRPKQEELASSWAHGSHVTGLGRRWQFLLCASQWNCRVSWWSGCGAIECPFPSEGCQTNIIVCVFLLARDRDASVT